MRSDLLERHITDTVKEWQMKIGYQKGMMKLYYPEQSLKELLETEDLAEGLEAFKQAVKQRLGEIGVSRKEDRFCLEIPDACCQYIDQEIPRPQLLQKLLAVITTPGNHMEQVRECFRAFAMEKGTDLTEEEGLDDDHGQVFYFADGKADPYVYCVEDDGFGLTYHRFSRAEYLELKNA